MFSKGKSIRVASTFSAHVIKVSFRMHYADKKWPSIKEVSREYGINYLGQNYDGLPLGKA